MIRSQTLRDSAKGEECTMNSPVCNYNPETTVLAHSGEKGDGKGKGLKAHDIFAAYCCSACHDWYDGRTHADVSRGTKAHYFHRAMKRTWLRYIEKNLITIKGQK